jgi:hypothetical protein
MAQEIINIGTSPNDGSGDPLRTAFAKVNNNFTQLFRTGWFTTESITFGNTQQEIFSVPVTSFTQGVFQINSVSANTQDSQNITITAAITNDNSGVKYSGHSTLFSGNVVSTYSMGVSGNSVILYASPFISGQASHFINYQITYNASTPSVLLALNGYSTEDVLGTENPDQAITTEQP